MSIIVAKAQEAAQKLKIDVDTHAATNTAEPWYAQTWIWIAGGLVFILVLLAILKSSGGNGK